MAKRDNNICSIKGGNTKNKKFVAIFFMVLAVFMILPFIADAAVFGGKYTRGISRVSYYIDYDSGTGYYEYLIIDAEHNWESPGFTSPVGMVAASSNAGTMLDIYTEDSNFWGGDTSVWGETRFYDQFANQQSPSVDYIFTRIYINDSAVHNISATKIRRMIIHEMGHAFGLAHNSNPYSIMYPYDEGHMVNTVQQVDVNDLNALYG